MHDEPREHHRVACQSLLRLPAITVVALAFFASGYCTSMILHRNRVLEEGNRRMLEALVNLIQTGAIEVNEDRLRELSDGASTNTENDTASAQGAKIITQDRGCSVVQTANFQRVLEVHPL